MDKLYDIIIVGAGPAGMTAAIYAKRAGLDVVIFEASAPGGKLVKTFEIDNWPGNPNISGVDLALQMLAHTEKLEIVTEYTGVKEVVDGKIKTVLTEDGRTFKTHAIIVATGTVENKMNIPGEEQNIGHGVSFCAVCDGAFFKNKEVVVIGGGNSALEESLYLTQFASKITIVIRRDVFRGDLMAQNAVLAHPKIVVLRKHIPIEVRSENKKVTGIVLKNVDTGETMELACAGIFPYIGAKASTGFVDNLGICQEDGYIKVNEKMETCIKGVYAAGDVTVKPLRQIVTATADGAVAAQMAFNYIKEYTSSH
ncbi:MAG: FAD-binding protein [Erysipelotrichales bacterium]|nr:MAG: FAD-binding protein [Erysipelotrichales bacterium]